MEEVAPEYDVVVLGTGIYYPSVAATKIANTTLGLTECVLSGYAVRIITAIKTALTSRQRLQCQRQEGAAH